MNIYTKNVLRNTAENAAELKNEHCFLNRLSYVI